MANHFSIFSVFLLLTAISSASAAKTCTIQRYGKLKTFVGEEYNVEIPCKYRLAEITCGDYEIKATAGSVKDGDQGRFSPDTLWVKVKSATAEWIGRTSTQLLQKAKESDKNPAWKKIGGNLDLEAEYRRGREAAVLKDSGSTVFKVEFSKADGVLVKCDSEPFTSLGYPKALCGDDKTKDVVKTRKQDKYKIPNISKDQVIAADVLGQSGVTQSANCQAAAKAFQSCGSQNQVAKKCTPIFTKQSAAKCLVNADNDLTSFENCQAWVCDSDTAACQNFRDTVNEECTSFSFNDYFKGITC